jgi:polysaccharide export outer membrane protein
VREKADATLLDTGQLSYAFVNLTPLTLPLFAAQPQPRILFSRAIMGARTPDVRIAVGDVLAITIFEAGGGGLFLPESPSGRAGSAQIPNQSVDGEGNITVPFVGQVQVRGRSVTEVQADIQEKLRARAIEPQVVVNIIERRGSGEVAILGEVGSPARIPVDARGINLVEAITRAGGTRAPHFESIITIQRRGRTERALMTHVVTDPTQNINLLPGDIVFVSREQRFYLAFGATLSSSGGLVGSSNRRYVFNEPNLTLADGVAQAGGLLDNRADASAVFLFRLVPKATLQKAGVDVSRFAGPLVPTIFNTDWSRPGGLFLANDFYLQHRDIIFVSNAPTQDISKYLSFINEVLGTVSNVVGTVSDVETFIGGGRVSGVGSSATGATTGTTTGAATAQ